MKRNLFHRSGRLGLALLLSAILTAPLAAQEAKEKRSPFDELVNRVLSGSPDITEADIIKMLADAKTVGKPFAANQAVKKYLKSNLKPSAEVLRLAAENAELAGDLRVAVSRYKGYLSQAPKGQAVSQSTSIYAMVVSLVLIFVV